MSIDEAGWWEIVPAGERISLAFVKIDRVGSTAVPPGRRNERESLPDATVRGRRARYTASIEDLARRTDAAQPLHFQGDGVMLFYRAGKDRKSASRCAFEAARALWERMTADLNQPVRIAVHGAPRVAWDPDTGKMMDPEIDLCGPLEHVAPEGSIALSERVYLALPAEIRRQIGRLGVTRRDGTPAWVYPGSAASRRDPEAFEADDDLALWSAFRAYATSPEIRRLRYAGFRLRRRAEPPSLDLGEVFVPQELDLRPRPFWKRGKRGPAQGTEAEQVAPWERAEDREDQNQPRLSLRDLEPHRSMVVLGDPGTGKTTLLRWLAVVTARGPEAMESALGFSERLVPLVVSLGRLAELRRSTGESSVTAVLARYFHDRDIGEVAAVEGFLAARLRAGSCLVLLDGLDEVRAEDRAALRGWLESFFGRFSENRWVVTSRVAGYRGIALPGAVEVVVRPWDEEQVKRYLLAFHRSYRAWETGQDDPSARREAERLFESLRAHGLLGLARNPFLASALALIHRAQGSLPRHRVQVYATFARALCETWSSARRLVSGGKDPSLRYEEEALPLLGRLALALHTDFPWGSAPEDTVLETLVEALEEKDVASEVARRAAGSFLERAAEEAGILYERRPPRGGTKGGPQPGEWAFLHLRFQDFFVAAGLHAEERFEAVTLEHLFEPHWLEVIRLGVGYYVLVQRRPRAALRFIEQVAGFRLTGKRSWITDVLHKQVPMALVLAAEAGDAVPPRIRKELAEKFFRWQYFLPLETIESIIDRISGTKLGEEVVRGVDFQNASFDDLAQEYEIDFLETESLRREWEERGGAAILSAASKALLGEKIEQDAFAWIALLGDLGGEEAVEVLLRLVEREVGDLDLYRAMAAMDGSALGTLALSQLWRISGGL